MNKNHFIHSNFIPSSNNKIALANGSFEATTSALHNIRGAGRKRRCSRKISTLSCHVLSCQKVGCLVEEIYLSYSEENNQVSYNSDPNPMTRYGGKPSLSAFGSTGGFEEQCTILHWILELCAIGSALVDGGLLDCNGLQ